MSIVFHPLWPKLHRYFRVEVYDKDGGHRQPRIRIELTKMPEKLREKALALQMPCVACGQPMHPIRARGDGALYYAAACPLDVNIGCSRGKAAKLEYNRIRAVFRPDLLPSPPRTHSPS